ncbi:GDSL-type esterase/lipase family protein [Agromyces ramosus]|uniref:Lysophospholipase L1-like esterase n=1 Tax=Agromyces ramosus TaxID=33879 RepID=A0ABU0RE18_9MICO|nr:GDSL-type esterase/lipase family protein [Agromyces ramosus]MDQ0895299.1 lysophospholipase L1-like esterase [Agromyces ramosus]
MTTKSRTRRLATLVSASFLIAGTAIFSALPAQAAPGQPGSSSGKVAYAALGDSYAAGVGGGEYLDPCFRSPNSYASIVADGPGMVHVALRGCASASTTDVVRTQLAGLDHRTKLVTLTVGANDLGLDALSAACLGGPIDLCLAAIAAAQANLGPLAASLSATLAAIDAAAPKATVIVTGYPLLVNAPADQMQALVNAGVAALNDVIEATVMAAGDDFVYVDVESEFAGHGLGSADPWLVGPPAPDAFHPNAAGYAAYADAILAAI